jgi:cyclase
LLNNNGLVKTIKFKNPTYVGDPINAVKIFNEKEVDELILIDINATAEQREPRYKEIKDIASEAFMPVCYGGGVTTVEQMRKLFALGVEKVSVSAAALETPAFVEQAARQFGSQSIIVTLDVKKSRFGRTYQIVTHNATIITKLIPLEVAQRMAEMGAGELLINSVDRDGLMNGYDEDLIKQISDAVHIPVIALGGAGSLQHLQSVVYNGGASAAAAGSMFVFHGKYKAVLINYPTQQELKKLFHKNK